MADLFDWWVEPEAKGTNKPDLLDVQLDLLARGRQAYEHGARRVIFQGGCGSGKTVVAAEQTARAVANGKRVVHIVHRRRLVDQMMSMLSRFSLYPSPIMDGRQTWESNVYCASRDTLLAMVKGGMRLPEADLLIIDECHVSSTMVLDWYLQQLPNAFWTGYTATPVAPSGKALKPPYQDLVCMGQSEALSRRLCPVKVYNPDELGKRRRKGEKVKPVGDPIAHWKKYALNQPTVVFAATVAESQSIVQKYLDAGISAEHIDANTPEAERDKVFDRSQTGKTKIISNVGVLIEGVDLPWLVCCQILRGCNSLVLWCQANGRVMRSCEGKTHGICLDHAGAAHEFGLPDGDFRWSLEDGKTNERNNKHSKDRKPIVCPACAFVFVGKPACPECGKVIPRKRRKSMLEQCANGDGILTEFTGIQNKHIAKDILERLAKKCYHIARAKGRTMAAANAMFSQEAKMPMWEAGLNLNLPKYSEWKLPAADWRL